MGKDHYQQYCASYIPDIVATRGADADKPDIYEFKNYSPFVHMGTGRPACTTLCGHERGMGNTAERLKHKVLGTRRRGLPAAGRFDHASGTGHVPCHAGDYVDAIQNRKAAVHLLVHETLGGMCSYSARRLRRLARDAALHGCDSTDYRASASARSFVPFYAQKISSAIVMNGMQGILDQLSHARHGRFRRWA